MASLDHTLANALDDALELLAEFLPADHAKLVEMQDVLAWANVRFAQVAMWERAKDIAERNRETV